MSDHKHIVIRLLLVSALASFLYGCNGASELIVQAPVDPGMSPVAITIADIHPWKKAQQIAMQVPDSDVMVGHGDAMLPIYQDGTVLVLQKLELDHLRRGMTIVFHGGREVAYDYRVKVLVKKTKDGSWELAGSTDNSGHYIEQLNEENYIGTVVAALARASEEQKIAEREFLVNSTNLNCTIQCHVAGETHPRVVPGLKAKITTFDLSEDN